MTLIIEIIDLLLLYSIIFRKYYFPIKSEKQKKKKKAKKRTDTYRKIYFMNLYFRFKNAKSAVDFDIAGACIFMTYFNTA